MEAGAASKKKFDPRAAIKKRKAREAKERGEGGSGLASLLTISVGVLSVSAVFLYRALLPQQFPLVAANITAPRIQLSDGRHVAIHEEGAPAGSAKYHVLVLHDLRGCRLSLLPNTSKAWLSGRGIRLVSYDRPGYGQSDPSPARTGRTEAQDILEAAGKLQLPQKFYVVAQGIGSTVAWPLIGQAPERIAGAALLSPWASFRMKSLSSSELLEAWSSLPRSERLPLLAARLGPWFVGALYAVTEKLGKVPNDELPASLALNETHLDRLDEYVPHWVAEAAKSALAAAGVARKGAAPQNVSERDLAVLQSEEVAHHLTQLSKEALLQGPGESEYRDLALAAADWGFDLSSLANKAEGLQGRVHLWYGQQDRIVPTVLQKYAVRVLPFVVLHAVDGGHYFLYEAKDWPLEILKELLQLPAAEEELASAASAKIA